MELSAKSMGPSSDVDIALPRRPVARSGEDVSLGKTFGDTPLLPAETPASPGVHHSHDQL